jgi:succinoglycan biosynthesis protein ExoM
MHVTKQDAYSDGAQVATSAPTVPVADVCVCICTCERPALLARLLERLRHQRTEGAFTYCVVVADNDPSCSARAVVESIATNLDVRYSSEPRRNISLARNHAIAHAKSRFVAFIDDDEFPQDDWLLTMYRACQTMRCAGVLGPVRPHFESPPPRWVVKGKFCERPEYVTGHRIEWRKSRTGNVLLRRDILEQDEEPFDPRFGNGGEDVDFFRRMQARGHVFRWCNEAAVLESVPSIRLTRRYMLSRALLRGRNTLKLGSKSYRAGLLAKSLVAVPVYLLLLPLARLAGDHVFMQIGIRLCDHAGRLLAAVGLNPVNAR